MQYRIMQIVRGGKVSQLADLSVFHGKTFAIVQQFETPYNKKDKNSLENLRDWRLIRESFPPRTICIIRYMYLYRQYKMLVTFSAYTYVCVCIL